MDIGREQPPYVIEPFDDPVPREAPEPAVPAEKLPAEPLEVPA